MMMMMMMMMMIFECPCAFFRTPATPPKTKKNTPPRTVRWRSASLSAAVEEGTKAVAGTRLAGFSGVETTQGWTTWVSPRPTSFFLWLEINQLDDDSKSLHKKWLFHLTMPLKNGGFQVRNLPGLQGSPFSGASC